jgi:predicted nucleic acid-binding protein
MTIGRPQASSRPAGARDRRDTIGIAAHALQLGAVLVSHDPIFARKIHTVDWHG